MPAFTALADADRVRFSEEIDADALAALPAEMQASVHAVARECDELL
jgi:hypothetical protein